MVKKTLGPAGQLTVANQKLEDVLFQLEKTQAELETTRAQLLQSEKMRGLGLMVAGVAHEINNPLGFARNNFVFLREKLPVVLSLFSQYEQLKTTAAPDVLDTIRKMENRAAIDELWKDVSDSIEEGLQGIDRIQEIVLSLRNFSRLDETELKKANINHGLQTTIRLMRPMFNTHIQIIEAYGPIPEILCRPGELNQVFLNLLTNSVQAIDGPGLIQVTTSRADGVIKIQIKDSGSGMSESILSKLGEPFFTTKPGSAGVGLGLTVSFSIIRRHNGSLKFESNAGIGTTAAIEIPMI